MATADSSRRRMREGLHGGSSASSSSPTPSQSKGFEAPSRTASKLSDVQETSKGAPSTEQQSRPSKDAVSSSKRVQPSTQSHRPKQPRRTSLKNMKVEVWVRIRDLLSENNLNWHDLVFAMHLAGIINSKYYDEIRYLNSGLHAMQEDTESLTKWRTKRRLLTTLDATWHQCIEIVREYDTSFEALFRYMWRRGYRPWLWRHYSYNEEGRVLGGKPDIRADDFLSLPLGHPDLSAIQPIEYALPEMELIDQSERLEQVHAREDARWATRVAKNDALRRTPSMPLLSRYKWSGKNLSRPFASRSEADNLDSSSSNESRSYESSPYGRSSISSLVFPDRRYSNRASNSTLGKQSRGSSKSEPGTIKGFFAYLGRRARGQQGRGDPPSQAAPPPPPPQRHEQRSKRRRRTEQPAKNTRLDPHAANKRKRKKKTRQGFRNKLRQKQKKYRKKQRDREKEKDDGRYGTHTIGALFKHASLSS